MANNLASDADHGICEVMNDTEKDVASDADRGFGDVVTEEIVASDAFERSVVINIDTEECCIHKVPTNLREVNREAYTPQLISIGPYHNGKEKLSDMEKHKLRYKEAFDKRITPDKWAELNKFIIDNENRIRHHYAEPSEFPSDEFVKMILYDAVFIIELFLIFWYRDRTDFLLSEVWLGAIRRDLHLLENQLPYFVLEELYKLAFASATEYELFDFLGLSGLFFEPYLSHITPLFIQPDVKINHFTDLCRYALVEIPTYPKFKGRKFLNDIPNTVKLKKSGVKFKPARYGEYLVDIILERKRPMWLFNVVELKIPRIQITDNTECLIRNLMALELCHYPSEAYICSYIDLMDSLINTENDVDLLVEKGIIYNSSGDNSVTADMFNKLQLQIPPNRYSYYYNIYNDLMDHYNSRWNHAMASLKSVYFSNPWRGTATVIAFILVLLTLIQAVFSVLQVVLAK